MLLSVSFLAVSPHRQGAMESNKVGPRDKVNKKKSEQDLLKCKKNIIDKVWKKEKSQHILSGRNLG